MTKRNILICLFLLCMTGIKAQTYCYHCYKYIDSMGVPEPQNEYIYITFKGALLWVSEKDGSYKIGYDGKRDKTIYKDLGEKVDTCFYYGMFEPQLMGPGATPFGRSLGEELYHEFYYLISTDKKIINKVTHIDGKFFTYCYELCPNNDCEKPTTPNVPPIKR